MQHAALLACHHFYRVLARLLMLFTSFTCADADTVLKRQSPLVDEFCVGLHTLNNCAKDHMFAHFSLISSDDLSDYYLVLLTTECCDSQQRMMMLASNANQKVYDTLIARVIVQARTTHIISFLNFISQLIQKCFPPSE